MQDSVFQHDQHGFILLYRTHPADNLPQRSPMLRPTCSCSLQSSQNHLHVQVQSLKAESPTDPKTGQAVFNGIIYVSREMNYIFRRQFQNLMSPSVFRFELPVNLCRFEAGNHDMLYQQSNLGVQKAIALRPSGNGMKAYFKYFTGEAPIYFFKSPC